MHKWNQLRILNVGGEEEVVPCLPCFTHSLAESPTAHDSVAPDHPVPSKSPWQPDCMSSVTHGNIPCHPRALEEPHEQKLIRQRTLSSNMYDSKFFTVALP